MKKILPALMLALASTGAMAEWAQVGINDVFTQYADFTTIGKASGKVRLWELFDYKNERKGMSGIGYLSEKMQREYDCGKEQVRLLAISGFSKRMGEGKVVYSVNVPTKWEPVKSTSIDDFLLVKACSSK